MIRLYFHPSPNPLKVTLFLEESGLAYEIAPVDTRRGEQHAPAFRAVNPNGKVPAIVDTEGPGGKAARVFDSSAILLYLGDEDRAVHRQARRLGPNCCPGSSSSRRGSGLTRARRCISSTRLPKSFPTPSTVIVARPSGTIAFSTII